MIVRAALLALFVFPTVSQAHLPEPSLPFQPLHAHDALEAHVHFGFDSRYYIEGRDGLDGDSIITTTIELGYEHLALGLWYGISSEQNYDEMQLSAAYTWHLGDFAYYLSWTHFQFFSLFPGSESDNDIGFGISYSELPYDLTLAFDGYYSIGVSGSFLQLSGSREFALTDALSMELVGAFGMNQGYVSDGSDGANHLALSAGFNYEINETISLTAHATQSWALDRNPLAAGDETLIDFFHAGVGVQFSF